MPESAACFDLRLDSTLFYVSLFVDLLINKLVAMLGGWRGLHLYSCCFDVVAVGEGCFE